MSIPEELRSMPLTPYPSLVTLPELIANSGKIPLPFLPDSMGGGPGGSSRIIYASAIPGVVLDCDIRTGAKIGGGTPTDNAARINAVLATATAARPIHLVIDGGSAMGSPLTIPTTG